MCFLRMINIKRFMVGYLGLLLVYASLLEDNWAVIWKDLLMILLYAAFDLLWTRWRDRVWYFPLSSLISGLVLSLVAIPNPPTYFVVILPIIAVISKHFLHFNRDRHVFNPAAFSLALVSLFSQIIAWWGPASGHEPASFGRLVRPDPSIILFFVIVFGGLFILWHQKKWPVASAFFAAQAFFLILLSLAAGASLPIYDVLGSRMFNSVTIFFATVMLIEPMTSTFGNWKNEFIYGFIVGSASIAIVYVEKNFSLISVDSLIFGLLIGDFIAGISFLPAKKTILQQF